MITMEELQVSMKQAHEKFAHLPEPVQGLAMHVHLTGAMTGRGDDDWAYSNYHALILDLAEPKSGQLALPNGFNVMEQQMCFRNAWELVQEDPTLLYCEGFARAGLLPVEHAWVETEDGRVIDPTWCGLEQAPEEAQYVGVRFDAEFAVRLSIRTGWASVFHGDDADGNHELLRRGLVMQDGIAIDMKEES